MRHLSLLILAAALFVRPMAAHGQSPGSAALVVIATDPSNAVVGGADVTLTDTGTG